MNSFARHAPAFRSGWHVPAQAACLSWALLGAFSSAMAADKISTHAASTVASPVEVRGAWIRATVKGQSGTGGFMQLISSQSLTVVGFASQVASSTELHEMSMDGNVMRMRAIDALPLPAGQAVSLQPGGHHIMLMGLKQPLQEGDTVALTILLKSGDGKLIKQEVSVPVKAAAPAGMGGGMAKPMGH